MDIGFLIDKKWQLVCNVCACFAHVVIYVCFLKYIMQISKLSSKHLSDLLLQIKFHILNQALMWPTMTRMVG